MRQISTSEGTYSIKGNPSECPFCHKSITPNFIFGYKNDRIIEVFMSCPNHSCNKSFISYYQYNGEWIFNDKTTNGELLGRNFSSTINEISPAFTNIFNQAYSAEQLDLKEICGVGYRKALEFLIKDFAIKSNPEHKEKIEKNLLGKCIEDYIDDIRIKNVAKRASWLGNDETHYIRKWEGKNLEDLKKLIDLTLHWIEIVLLTNSISDDMPE